MSRHPTAKFVGRGWSWLQPWACLVCLALCATLFGVSNASGELFPDEVVATNALQLRRLIARPEALSCSARVEGTVLWTSPAQDQIILQDDSGGVSVTMNLRDQPSLQPGQRVRLEGSGRAGRGGIFSEPLVDDDGTHTISEKLGTTYLTAGFLPIRLEWFNGPLDFACELNWMGPETPWQIFPSSSLFHAESDPVTGVRQLVPGLDYQGYEGNWKQLPDFTKLSAVKKGVVTNFDLSVRSRSTNVALVFRGFLQVPCDGFYQFSLKSDDGAKFYIDKPPIRLSLLGQTNLPAPNRISPGKVIREEQECQWAEAEGTVTHVSELSGAVFLELSSNRGRLYLKVMQGGSLELLLHSRIRATGVCQTAFLLDGQAVPSLLVPDLTRIAIVEMASAHGSDTLVTNLVLKESFQRHFDQKSADTNILPTLTTVAQVKHLIRAEALRGYPVKMRGVITARLGDGFTIQDSTWSVFMRWRDRPDHDPLRIGEYWEIEGLTYMGFAPNVHIVRATCLGPGIMPEPLHPTRDELLNGSLDTQYVEIQGVASAVETNGLAVAGSRCNSTTWKPMRSRTWTAR